ncbi:MAG: glycosyltransferase [Pyrinomonadaceae bacterium]|nr:glycosyltransferase [Sphingobacteriaceae bacterium]
MKESLISIALCTYNGETHIKEQLESILKQSYTNLEIIVVDDCSGDNTFSILQQIAETDTRIKIYQNDKNLGFNKNFEKAISLTSGDLIAISDQDDIWLPSKIQDLNNCIGNKWLVFSNSAFLTPAGITQGKLVENIIPNTLTYTALLLNNVVTGHTILFKREFLPYVLPIPHLGYYDWYMGFIAAYHNQIDFCNKVLTRYRIHPGSVIQKRHSKILSENVKGEENFRLVYAQLNAFLSYKGLKPEDKLFIETLKDSYLKKTRGFSVNLFRIIMSRYDELFLNKKRKGLSLLNFALKFSRKISIKAFENRN